MKFLVPILRKLSKILNFRGKIKKKKFSDILEEIMIDSNKVEENELVKFLGPILRKLSGKIKKKNC